jgi:DNA/RNA-binding domain of Phe-tRNA-synthetase-like protein
MSSPENQSVIPVSADPEVFERHPGTRIALIAARASAYDDDDQARRAEEAVIRRVRAAHAGEDAVRARPEADAYRDFYRSMGLKAAQVSTPVKQAARVLRTNRYSARSPVVDVAMEIEYETLLSFQVYDAAKLAGAVRFCLADGAEPITTMRDEAKTCKPGELVLKSAGAVAHSSYYGNHRAFALDSGSTTALVRVMAIPGVQDDAFDRAVAEAVERLGSDRPVVLEAGAPAGSIRWPSIPQEVAS